MQTQTMNSETTTQPTSLINVILATIVGSIILFSGFLLSLFLLILSAVLFPFAALKIWLLQKQFKEKGQPMQSSSNDESTIIEGEFIVTETSKETK